MKRTTLLSIILIGHFLMGHLVQGQQADSEVVTQIQKIEEEIAIVQKALNDSYKELKKLVKAKELDAIKDTVTSHNNSLKTKLQVLNTEVKSLRKTIAEMEKELNRKTQDLETYRIRNEQLAPSGERLSKLQKSYDLARDSINGYYTHNLLILDTIRIEFNKLQIENKSLKVDTANINIKLGEANKEMKRLQPFERKIGILETEKSKLDKELSSKKQIIGNQETTIREKEGKINELTDAATKSTTIQRQLEEQLVYSVGLLTNSSDYNVVKTEILIKQCQEFQFVNTNQYIEKLKKYLKLSKAIEMSKMVLRKAYQVATITQALRALNNVTGFNKTQRADIEQYKKLLENYCKVTNCLHQEKEALGQSWLDDPKHYREQMTDYFAINVKDAYLYLQRFKDSGRENLKKAAGCSCD